MPEAGTEVKPGRKVYLVVNKREKPSFPMPDLLGRPEFDARQSAARMEIVIQDVQVSSVTNPEEDGRVLNQSIPAQAIVKSGTPVSIIIGKYEASPEGTNKIVIPDVLGMSLSRQSRLLPMQVSSLELLKPNIQPFLYPIRLSARSPLLVLLFRLISRLN